LSLEGKEIWAKTSDGREFPCPKCGSLLEPREGARWYCPSESCSVFYIRARIKLTREYPRAVPYLEIIEVKYCARLEAS